MMSASVRCALAAFLACVMLSSCSMSAFAPGKNDSENTLEWTFGTEGHSESADDSDTDAVSVGTDELPFDRAGVDVQTDDTAVETEPEIPSAERRSTLCSMTGTLPVISVANESGLSLPRETESRVVIPSLIGHYETVLAEYEIPNVEITFAYDWYPLPVGVIYAVELSGEITDTEFSILPGTEMILYVSQGINPENIVLEAENKTVYLTFDDGPNYKNTISILDTLEQYGIHATFFMVGSYVERYPEIVQEVYERGHAIGCHSYSHRYANLYAGTESITEEILLWETAVENAIGVVPPTRLFRYPGGSTNCADVSIREAMPAMGFRCFDWNALNNDCLLHTRPEGMEELAYMQESFLSTIAYSFRLKRSPHIVLMHDTYTQTAELLPWMIEYLQEQGCEFSTLDTLSSGWTY